MTNTLLLNFAIKRAGLTQKEVSRRLKLSDMGFYRKATNLTEFKASEIAALSIAAIVEFNCAGIKCTVLTKGVLPIELADMSKANEYGITLVSLSEDFRARYEPHAAPYADRIQALKRLHERGCQTWVSMEPYPTPNLIEQKLSDVLDAVSFVDKIIFGRTNYSREVSAYPDHKYFYTYSAGEFLNFCEARNINYHIKAGTITEDFT